MDTPTFLDDYRLRPLDVSNSDKPLDFGGGPITGSVNQDGRILSINMAHPEYGYVTLTSAEPFPEAERYNPDAVRAYRANLAQLDGFGLHFKAQIVERQVYLVEDMIPLIRLIFANGTIADCLTFVPGDTGVGVFQLWRFEGGRLDGEWRGRLSLQRCAYTQLTEGGPIPPPPVKSFVSDERRIIALENTALAQSVAIAYLPAEGVYAYKPDGTMTFSGIFHTDGETVLCYAYGFNQHAEVARKQAEALYRAWQHSEDPFLLLHQTLKKWRLVWQGWPHEQHPLDAILRRGLIYSWQCAIPVADSTCLITDHQLLPLSWNRDSYYAARALLAWDPAMWDVVRGHLAWIFTVADRVDGLWGRAYLVNGRVKDPAFQLDQQLFPLLECTDYLVKTGDDAFFDPLRPQMTQVVDKLLSREWHDSGLFPTDETPADDPVDMPYHLSSHILLWHTFRRLAQYLDDDRLLATATRVQAAIQTHFVTEQNGQPLYAYLTDGAGGHQLYHDANDLPLVLAPIWGFCPVDDPLWRNTMDFAFSKANKDGYYPGQYGGLGSVHTRATWPLGDVQEMLYAQLTGDKPRLQSVIERLKAVAQWDGALPEAYDPQTGKVVSRSWFVWPGAALVLAVSGY